MTDEDSIRLRDRRWMWLTARIALWVLIAALSTALLLTMAASIVAAFQTAAAPGEEHWSDRTGAVGDTFGGLLGPFLNALVLGVTAVLAVAWQPRRDRRQEPSPWWRGSRGRMPTTRVSSSRTARARSPMTSA